MAVTQIVLSNAAIFDGYDFSPSIHWDGYVCSTSLTFTEGTFQGYSLNWGTSEMPTTMGAFSSNQYAGYNTNWGSLTMPNIDNAFVNQLYAGYNTNWGATDEPLLRSTPAVLDFDINATIDHPKDQTVYYKLKGWNPLTSTYETWVITENITGRPELFDPIPGREPANVERDVFKTPPSGNNLVNIVIAARWIQ